MTRLGWLDIEPATPELLLAALAMALLMFGAFRPGAAARDASWLALAALAAAAIMVLAVGPETQTAFGGLFVTDRFGAFMKILVLAGSGYAAVMAIDFNRREDIGGFEYPVLILFAALGMMMMISAADLIALYVGLELQSLALYVVAAYRRDSVASTEAGLKYFVLGALSSGLLLYGSSLIYGFAGTTRFEGLVAAFAAGGGVPIGVVFGLALIAAGLAFKVSAVPFHMWTPDVYQGAPTPVTAFFALAPKIAAIALLVRVMIVPFGHLAAEWQQIIVFLSLASMLLGAVAAIAQTNIKRLMAYSSIGHVGYALVGLAAGTESGVRGVLIYFAIYLVMTAGAFAGILAMRRKGVMTEDIADLSGLARTRPMLAAAMAIFMFALAGVPPLSGFFAKLYVFLAAIESGLYALAVIGVLASVVAAYYYLRIVKLMYFDEPAAPFDRASGRLGSGILAACALATLLFFVYPTPVLTQAAAAARALFAG